MAQKRDSIPVRSLVEKGTCGDIILGKETKKDQLMNSPRKLLPDPESSVYPKKKKMKHKKEQSKK